MSKWFTVEITLPKNKIIKSVVADSSYHAIDKMYTRFCHIESDRNKYKINNQRAKN